MPATFSSPATRMPHPSGLPPLPVLILDDERFDRHRLARLCSGLRFPCAVSNAKTLEEFGAHLERDSYRLILVDYALPDGTGLDALDMVRLSARNLNAATLMVSGQAAAQVAEKAVSIGCSGHLAKDDLSPASFAAAVERALASATPPAETPKAEYPAEDVERLLARCATRCARDVKPMISRMMRQMRDLRATGGAAQALDALEQNCMSLWAFLIEMEREDGAQLLAELTGDRTQAQIQPRPPSPFGRRTH